MTPTAKGWQDNNRPRRFSQHFSINFCLLQKLALDVRHGSYYNVLVDTTVHSRQTAMLKGAAELRALKASRVEITLITALLSALGLAAGYQSLRLQPISPTRRYRTRPSVPSSA